MLSVLFHTLGCKLNQLESEAFADAFRQAGFVAHNPSYGISPSIIVVNTCTVTSKADQKARRVIRKALRDYPDSRVLVTGCYAQLDKQEIDGLDGGKKERLFVVKGMDKESILKLPLYLGENSNPSAAPGARCEICMTDNGTNARRQTNAFQFNPERFSSHTRSFLKIQDGCDKHCTYCRIRLARGLAVSLDPAEVLARLRMLEKNHAEAVLTGVNISLYRDEKGAAGLAANSLGGLLEYLLSGTSTICLRLSSLAPGSVDENLAEILCHKRIRPHFHLSIQSGSEKILERMGRACSVNTIEKAVSLLRGAKDDPFLACDIIAGFPGETETEFNSTLELCRKTGFSWIHVFPYSKRPGTPAWSFSGAVQEKEITKRVRLLTDIAWQGRAAYVKRWIGREVEVLTEKRNCSKSFYRGISENYLKLLVRREGDPPLPGAVLRCKITEEPCTGADYDAVAQPLLLNKNATKKEKFFSEST